METIFDKAGKRTPYSVPDNYFETISEKLVNEALRSQQPKRRSLKLISFSSVAAAAAVLLCIFLLSPVSKSNPQAEYDNALDEYCNSIAGEDYETMDGMLADVDLFWQYKE